MTTVIYIIGILLAILGISEIIHSLALWLTRPKIMPKRVLIVSLDEAMAEAQVMAVLCEFHWSGKKYADRAVFLTDNLTENTIKKLKRLYSGTYAEFKNGVSLYGRQEQSDV